MIEQEPAMTLSVKQLIAALKKLPPNAKVVVLDHDQNPESGEFNGFVCRVEEAPDAIQKRGAGVLICP